MKLKQLVDSKEAIIRLSSANLPINISWSLKKFMKTVDPIIMSFEETRNQRIRELGEVKGDGRDEKYTVTSENMPKYLFEIDSILSEEISVDVPVIKIGELLEHRDTNGKAIKITTADMIQLDWLIVE